MRVFRIAVPASDVDRARAFYGRPLAVEADDTVPQPWGERSFYCLDLDGNRLCFVDEATLVPGRGAAWS